MVPFFLTCVNNNNHVFFFVLLNAPLNVPVKKGCKQYLLELVDRLPQMGLGRIKGSRRGQDKAFRPCLVFLYCWLISVVPYAVLWWLRCCVVTVPS